MNSYQIKRECWNEHTFNGYKDSPYWRISFEGYVIGVKDNGEHWDINNRNYFNDYNYIRGKLKRIIKECRLNIRLKKKNWNA